MQYTGNAHREYQDKMDGILKNQKGEAKGELSIIQGGHL